jgi:4a-hydroxytetrahydrobiopterin dehydratase
MWQEENDQLTRVFEFSDFTEAWVFMTKVAFVAERLNHHPNWTNTYNTVTINLYTHDAGNVVTEKDLELAEEIDKIAAKYPKAKIIE